jgi:peptidoglycan/LPS O-acetylase OafA/YrhL
VESRITTPVERRAVQAGAIGLFLILLALLGIMFGELAGWKPPNGASELLFASGAAMMAAFRRPPGSRPRRVLTLLLAGVLGMIALARITGHGDLKLASGAVAFCLGILMVLSSLRRTSS